MRTHTVLRLVPVLLVALAGAAFVDAAPRRAHPHNLVITATDYAFQAPDTVPAGLTRVQLASNGKEFHHVQLVRIPSGRELRDVMQVMSAKGAFPSWLTFVGGPEATLGGNGDVTMQLEPGKYAVICVISSPHDGVRHVAKGMAREITVVPSSRRREPAPRADTRLTLDDYSFTFAPSLTAGRHTIAVENKAAQPHHVEIMKLEPGKTADDAMAWSRTRQGPPPFQVWGGTSALSPGKTVTLTGDFTRGSYLLVCFVPDATDGRSHLAHGMLQVLTIE